MCGLTYGTLDSQTIGQRAGGLWMAIMGVQAVLVATLHVVAGDPERGAVSLVLFSVCAAYAGPARDSSFFGLAAFAPRRRRDLAAASF